MDWPVYIIGALTLASLLISLVLQFRYRSQTAPRWQLIAADCTVLVLCISLITKGTP